MAMLWRKTIEGTRYEVRMAGGTKRLYTNGVFHSQYNANTPVTGGVWDLLMVPAFFAPRGSVRRILVLGVGAGTVLLQLRHFLDPEALIGVDYDPTHLQVAKGLFNVSEEVASLVEADAVEWLRSYDGPPFDLIVEDLFGHGQGEPERTVAMDVPWARLLLRRLTPKGILAVNFISSRELGRSSLASSSSMRHRLSAAFRLWNPNEENCVGAFLRFPVASRVLRRQLSTVRHLDTRRKSCRLGFSLSRLW